MDGPWGHIFKRSIKANPVQKYGIVIIEIGLSVDVRIQCKMYVKLFLIFNVTIVSVTWAQNLIQTSGKNILNSQGFVQVCGAFNRLKTL